MDMTDSRGARLQMSRAECCLSRELSQGDGLSCGRRLRDGFGVEAWEFLRYGHGLLRREHALHAGWMQVSVRVSSATCVCHAWR